MVPAPRRPAPPVPAAGLLPLERAVGNGAEAGGVEVGGEAAAADLGGGLGAGGGGVEGGRDPVTGRVGGGVAGLTEQLHGRPDQAGDGVALGLGGRPELGRALAGQGGLVGGAQPLARGQQRAEPVSRPAGELVDRPGRQGRAPQRLDLLGRLGLALAPEAAGQVVPGGHELLGGQPEQLVARLRIGQLAHLLVPLQLAACEPAWVE